jgi:predicted GIY-YIG superfamily endonuclease
MCGTNCRALSVSKCTSSFCVYILVCADGSLYVGQTRNLSERLAAHQAGRAARHTRERLPVRVVYSEKCASAVEATQRERQIERWTRAKKLALIAVDLERLKRLSSNRRRRLKDWSR